MIQSLQVGFTGNFVPDCPLKPVFSGYWIGNLMRLEMNEMKISELFSKNWFGTTNLQLI